MPSTKSEAKAKGATNLYVRAWKNVLLIPCLVTVIVDELQVRQVL